MLEIIARKQLGDALTAAGDRRITRCIRLRGVWVINAVRRV